MFHYNARELNDVLSDNTVNALEITRVTNCVLALKVTNNFEGNAAHESATLTVGGAIPFGRILLNPVLHMLNVLPELKHLPPWQKFPQANYRYQPELRAS